jgi:hypothetical protein
VYERFFPNEPVTASRNWKALNSSVVRLFNKFGCQQVRAAKKRKNCGTLIVIYFSSTKRSPGFVEQSNVRKSSSMAISPYLDRVDGQNLESDDRLHEGQVLAAKIVRRSAYETF